MTRKNDPFIKEIANKLIDAIKAGTAPWQREWDNASIPEFPNSAITHKPYNGINALLLYAVAAEKGYKDSRWVTFKQVAAKKGKIKKGEHGVKCVFFSPSKYKTYDEAGEEVVKNSMIMNRFVLFNVEQTEGIDWNKDKVEHHWEPIETAENILKNSHANIVHVAQNQAFYCPSTDSITLPEKTQFRSSSGYYDTALHELGHWTGHKDRLNRKVTGSFGSHSYAKEELIAEIASMMIASTIGLPHNTGKHASYCESWIEVLENDPSEIFKAASAASKIKDYVMKFAQ